MKKELHMLMWQVTKMYFGRNFLLFDELGVHPRQIPILITIKNNDGISQKKIAESLMVSAPSVAVSLKRLEKNGLITKNTDSADQRIFRIYLSQKGRDALEKAENIMQQLYFEAFKDFTTEELVLLKRFLVNIKTNLSEVVDETQFHIKPHFTEKERHNEANNEIS